MSSGVEDIHTTYNLRRGGSQDAPEERNAALRNINSIDTFVVV